MQVPLNIKPFHSVGDAIDGLEIAFSFPKTIKFKCDSFSSYERERLVKLLTACKSILTIEEKFYEFKKTYHIDCVTKLFWDYTTWSVEVKDFRRRVKVYSGTPLGGYVNEYATTHDEQPFFAKKMIAQFQNFLNEAQTKWGSNFEWMYNREIRIISQESKINRYAPCGDYYDIYSGNRKI